MSTPLESVEAAALELTVEERAALIERLIDTVIPAPCACWNSCRGSAGAGRGVEGVTDG